jgi:hypothetical protein
MPPASAVMKNLPGGGVALHADLLPPRLDRCDGEDRGVVIGAGEWNYVVHPRP